MRKTTAETVRRADAPNTARRSVFAIERACDVVAAICADIARPKGVKDISEALGLSMGSVHRVLVALVHKGLVRQDADTHKYLVGTWLLEVALTYLRQLDLPQVALPYMNRLREVTKETVTLSIRDGMTRIYLAQVESPQEIRQTVETGRRVPLHLGGSGKAILAFLSDDERDAYLALAELAPPVDGPINLAALRRDLQAVRRRGFASSRAERLPGAASVAAPIRDYNGAVIGCLSISGPVGRFSDNCVQSYGRLVAATADEVSRGLGMPSLEPRVKSSLQKAA
jgi:IclR family acetate operon transcriptional repressor